MTDGAASRDWDAATYDRVSDPQVEWALELLERLRLRGDEVVLDAGCGSGRVTRLLIDRLAEGRVIAVDAAPSMVERARAALGERATVLEADLQNLSLSEPVDVAFSNAVFHWVEDHDRLFGSLFASLRPGGRLVAQCGGTGNVALFLDAADAVARDEPYAPHLDGWRGPWCFAGPDETRARLEQAGFEDVETWLEPRLVRPREALEFLRTVCLGRHLEALPEALRDPYARAVLDRCGHPLTLDYVRLNMEARRPA